MCDATAPAATDGGRVAEPALRGRAPKPAGLPEDPSWHGFDRIGAVLSLAPSQVEKYLAAAETVVQEALPEVARKKISGRNDVWDLRYHGSQKQKAEKLGLADRARVSSSVAYGGSGELGQTPGPSAFSEWSGASEQSARRAMMYFTS